MIGVGSELLSSKPLGSNWLVCIGKCEKPRILMKGKKSKNPADSLAQHLANLIGTSVAGFVPEASDGSAHEIDLNTELFRNNNMAIARLVVVSGLVQGDSAAKTRILKMIKPDYLGEKSFSAYLFSYAAELLGEAGKISIEKVEASISDYGPKVFGKPLDKNFVMGVHYKWSQIMNFHPTAKQLDRSIHLCRIDAREKGLIEE